MRITPILTFWYVFLGTVQAFATVDERLRLLSASTTEGDVVSFMVHISSTPPPARWLSSVDEHAEIMWEHLTETASHTQAPIVEAIRKLECGVLAIRPYWIVNRLAIDAKKSCINLIATIPGVERISVNQLFPVEAKDDLLQVEHLRGDKGDGIQDSNESEERQLASTRSLNDPLEPEWHVKWANADDVWEMGYRGEGIVIAVVDTGAEVSHPALMHAYRGNHFLEDDVTGDLVLDYTDHNYNWWDPYDRTLEASDGFSHGTHVSGIAVGGRDRAIGIAPDAKLMLCRGISLSGLGSVEGNNPRTDLRPDIINNSFSCTFCELNDLDEVIRNLVDAGVAFTAAAQNDGPECGTILQTPGIVEEAFTVGAQDRDTILIAPFSSKGPVIVDSSNRLKPDIVAPGLAIFSSVTQESSELGYKLSSGTSMATPVVSGTMALVMQACPNVTRSVKNVEKFLIASATKVETRECEIDGNSRSPNNVYGHGGVDVLKAVELCLICEEAVQEATNCQNSGKKSKSDKKEKGDKKEKSAKKSDKKKGGKSNEEECDAGVEVDISVICFSE